MKILLVLTYYRPHISGLTIYVERLAQGLAARGHQVTVLASQHAPELPREEVVEGVRVIRAPVAVTMGKGVLAPTFTLLALRLAGRHDVVNVHLPELQGGLVSAVCRTLAKARVVLTYHCDLQLPPGRASRALDRGVFGMNLLAGQFAHAIVAYTEDYATHSRFLSKFPGKIRIIPPPVVLDPVQPAKREALRQQLGLDGKRLVGVCTRVAADKGIEYLLQAIPLLESEVPDVHILHAGEYSNVLGEEEYRARLQPLIDRFQDRVTFLGVLPQEQLPSYFANLDLLVVSSVNSTESFGLVQVESMLSGTPVVATNLPGVREPVRMTGMGEIVQPRDPSSLAAGIVQVIRNRDSYLQPREAVARVFDLEATLEAYERVYTGDA